MKKLLSTTLAVGIFTSLSISPAFAIAANTLPTGEHNMSNANVTRPTDHNMNVQVNGGNGTVGTVHWGTFNVGKDANVNFEFTNNNQTALNIVDKSGGLSEIYGSLTNSCGASCGYVGTGKVVLINPNGVLFGSSANVNLNSFTVSTLDGKYDAQKQALELTKGEGAGSIKVYGKIHGDKNVTLAAPNIYTYTGSKITTNITPNVGDTAYGKVKLVTADGVNFTYYNNGAVKQVENLKASTDKMQIILNGDIDAGHIDIRNQSVNTESDINIAAGAKLKATKAAKGNDGEIWLTSANQINMENANLTTEKGGNIRILGNKKVSIGKSNISSSNNVYVTSDKDNIVIKNSTIAGSDAELNAGKIAALEDNSHFYGHNFNMKGGQRAQVLNSSISAGTSSYDGKVTIEGKDGAYIHNSYVGTMNADVTGGKVSVKDSQIFVADKDRSKSSNVNLTATTGDVTISNSKLISGNYLNGENYTNGQINITAKGNVNADKADFSNSKTNMKAGKDIVATNIKGVNARTNGLVAEAENNVTISTDETLSVSRLVAKNGDMTLTADKVIAGNPKVTGDYLRNPGDSSDRAYIYVLNGKFTSNTKNDSYKVTDSADPVNPSEGYLNKRHHIEYGNGSEKILLVNKRPYTPAVTPSTSTVETPSADDTQAKMLNKIPRQPEIFNNNTQITNSRTSLVDVFAAASQIEIEDDDEEE